MTDMQQAELFNSSFIIHARVFIPPPISESPKNARSYYNSVVVMSQQVCHAFIPSQYKDYLAHNYVAAVYSEKCFAQTNKALYRDAMLVPPRRGIRHGVRI